MRCILTLPKGINNSKTQVFHQSQIMKLTDQLNKLLDLLKSFVRTKISTECFKVSNP